MSTTHASSGISLKDYEESDEYNILRQQLTVATTRIFGKEPREFQLRVALALHGGYDVLCVAATNAGKTLSFIMPILLNPKAVIMVISPLKSIMDDHVR
ncbi:hypothetical protein L211DRAFT_781668 [Terfezia boudieri ATCC MYA-4762]|uniref:DEAD/DEAH-box helicase domain-containing protein n=1 Tax=Terfezia boudieri ATCC MYA-4762 TaxID=1051890 RepID=A0A3N4LX43_9PEZI|nr:hypothetical protein L211DRAFT_781668 [Terfezia boudieri ATCC MYA-4762]